MRFMTLKEVTVLCGFVLLSMLINSVKAREMIANDSNTPMGINSSISASIFNKEEIAGALSRNQLSYGFPVPVKNIEACNSCHASDEDGLNTTKTDFL